MRKKGLGPELPGRESQRVCEKLIVSLPGWRPTCAGVNRRIRQGQFYQGFMQVNRTAKYLVLWFCMFFLIGCTHSNQQTPYNESVRTNLYGELDGWQPVSFSAKPFSSLEQHSFCEEGGDYDPDLSTDGKWIVYSSLQHSPNPDLYIKQVHGATSTRLTSDAASEIQPAFSPNGEQVAYASNRVGNWDVWVIGVDGSNPTRITDGASNDIHPSWSPDGKQIVYCSLGSRSKQWELWVVNVENPGNKKWIGYGLFPEWNPNPKIPKIAFQQSRYRGSQWFSIWTVDIVGGEAKFPTEIVSSTQHACICPSWSADGMHLTYSTVSRGQFEKSDDPAPEFNGEDIWIVDLDGRNILRLTSSDSSSFSPTWSSDGRVFFCSDRKGIENIWSILPNQINFNAQKPIDLSQHPQNSGIQAN